MGHETRTYVNVYSVGGSLVAVYHADAACWCKCEGYNAYCFKLVDGKLEREYQRAETRTELGAVRSAARKAGHTGKPEFDVCLAVPSREFEVYGRVVDGHSVLEKWWTVEERDIFTALAKWYEPTPTGYFLFVSGQQKREFDNLIDAMEAFYAVNLRELGFGSFKRVSASYEGEDFKRVIAHKAFE